MSVYSGDKYTGLSEYMLYGGIPLVVLRDGAGDKATALQNLFNEIYIRDITKRNQSKEYWGIGRSAKYSFLCDRFVDQSGKTKEHF